MDFSPSGLDLALSHGTSPYIHIYPWTTGTGFGTKYANPATLPSGATGYDVSFSPYGNDIAYGSGTVSPTISVYPWISGTGFGTKYANPNIATGTTVYSVSFAALTA